MRMQKKRRGKKRYYRNLVKTAQYTDLNVTKNSSFNLFHQHFDYYGEGNRSLKKRLTYTELLFICFDNYLNQLQHFPKEYQLWIMIHEAESSLDAVYTHSENPYQTEFPIQFKKELISEYPAFLAPFIDENQHIVYKSEGCFLVFSKNDNNLRNL